MTSVTTRRSTPALLVTINVMLGSGAPEGPRTTPLMVARWAYAIAGESNRKTAAAHTTTAAVGGHLM